MVENRIGKACLHIDYFPSVINFSFDGSKQYFKTRAGSFMTVIIFFVMTFTAVQRGIKMFKLEDIKILDNTLANYYEEDFVFGNADSQNKFNFGVTISPFQEPDFEINNYLDYGSLNLYYEIWDDKTDVLIPIRTKACDKNFFPKQETDGNKSQIEEISKMFPINTNKQQELEDLIRN